MSILETRRVRRVIPMAFAAVLSVFVCAQAQAQGGGPSSFSLLGGEITRDFEFIVNSAQMDAEDVLTSPLYILSDNSVLRSPKFYLGLAGAGALFGASFSLDQTMRSHLRDMGSSTANTLQDVSYGSVGAASALLYVYGLYADDVRARETIITAAEGAGVATILDLGIKAAFGRLRPRQDHHSHTQFFDGGASFVSGEVTPMFGLAAGISEYFDNEWYVALPIYALAMTDGFGRMGHDAHWFSDVVGAALLGWGTTELFLYLHRQQDAEPSRWRIFPASEAPSPAGASVPGAGLGFGYSW